ncbi:MAG: UPF0179 family protein [Candidatus Thermoplasmatota archaeon]
MVTITVAGKGQAVEGREFVYMGPLSACRECKVRNICFHLEPGRHYVVRRVRDASHPCNIHEGGVRVVEVEEVPFEISVPSKLAIEGSTITFQAPKCAKIGCRYYDLCMPQGLRGEQKLQVIRTGEPIECTNGEERRRVAVL